MKKKTLKEIFEFFPKANYITQDSGDRDYCIKLHSSRPFIAKTMSSAPWWMNSFTTTELGKPFTIDWGDKTTWEKRCADRKDFIK